MSLSLNKSLATFWRNEPVVKDCFGRPDFDVLAITKSGMTENQSIDVYRLGKSLRKKGFDVPRFTGELGGIARATNAGTSKWWSEQPAFNITPGISGLAQKRIWNCNLREGLAKIPCGGTHKIDGQNSGVTVTFDWDAEENLIVKSRVE